MNYKFVFDTNALISAALLKNSINAQALTHALNIGRIAISEPVLQEFETVIFRKKFDKYFFDDSERLEVIDRIESNSLFYFPKVTISICRDIKDNKFLELALAAGADCIITGDQDLLILNPFQNIPIMSAAMFLEVF
jgi:putative PIN family toxin of toxin-antitoxin system